GRLTAYASNSTVVLAGTMSNATTIAAGTVRVPSGGKLATAGAIIVGNTNSTGVLNVTGGSVFADNNGGQFTPSIAAGSTAGSAGSIQVGSGIFLTSQQIGLGAGQGGYASLDVSGGTVGVGSYIVAGWGGDTAVLNQSGGTLSVLTNCLTIGAGNTNSVGVATFSGGAFFSMNSTNGNSGGRGGAFVGENGTGTMNVMGTASVNLFGDANLVLGRTGTGSAGTVNLVGGALATAQVSKGAGSGTFNFNGGLLKALTNNASFMSGLSSANVYSGGARIDDGGFNVTAAQPLLAPTGYGVSTISMASGGAGYIDAPVVTITGGSGSGATAIATVSGGAVTGFTVTCPGTGYSSGDSLAVTITGGGGSGAAANTPLLAANVGGNLVKQGAGTLTLGGADNYTGYTLVSTGGLFVTPAHQVTGAVTNANNATFGVLVNGAGTATIGNLTLGTIATGTNYLAMTLATGTNPAAPVLQAGTLTLTGTNWVKLSGVLTAGIFPALQYSGAMAGSGQFNTNVLAPQGVAATLSNDVAHSTLYVVVNSTGPGLVWTGNNSAPALTNLWQNG
ncbi:MAG TPA: hypothetical protein VFU81_05790, partial [Thermomicrobiales bacterium]|nr:hypothetical protein [Thermomicrobiales bacterium]